jgi:hypothetical protein
MLVFFILMKSVVKFKNVKLDKDGRPCVVSYNVSYFVKIIVRGSEETCNRKARDLEKLLLTEKESSVDDVESDKNKENNKSLNYHEAISSSEEEPTESTHKKYNEIKKNKSILAAAKKKK